MGAEIIKMYRQDIPALRFIGKKYGEEDRVDEMYSKHWADWLQAGLFGVLEKQAGMDPKAIYADGDAYIGMMRLKKNEPFEYWIGMFMPEGTRVPDGFEHRDFPQASLGVCWVYGNEGEIFMQEDRCRRRLEAEGHTIAAHSDGAFWLFERYCSPRFTEPDAQGNCVLDICWYVK
jgi:hypothetical protein